MGRRRSTRQGELLGGYRGRRGGGRGARAVLPWRARQPYGCRSIERTEVKRLVLSNESNHTRCPPPWFSPPVRTRQARQARHMGRRLATRASASGGSSTVRTPCFMRRGGALLRRSTSLRSHSARWRSILCRDRIAARAARARGREREREGSG